MNTQLQEIKEHLTLNSTGEAREAFRKFIPGNDRIYGVRMPVLNTLAAKFRTGGFPLVKELWKAGSFEERMIAVKILGKIAKKGPDLSISLVKKFSANITNWAICDALGMQALKPLVETEQEKIFLLAEKLNSSTDMWQRRLSLVLVEYYTRKKELHARIKKLIKPIENDEEYYEKKAIVWINRNFHMKK